MCLFLIDYVLGFFSSQLFDGERNMAVSQRQCKLDFESKVYF